MEESGIAYGKVRGEIRRRAPLPTPPPRHLPAPAAASGEDAGCRRDRPRGAVWCRSEGWPGRRPRRQPQRQRRPRPAMWRSPGKSASWMAAPAVRPAAARLVPGRPLPAGGRPGLLGLPLQLGDARLQASIQSIALIHLPPQAIQLPVKRKSRGSCTRTRGSQKRRQGQDRMQELPPEGSRTPQEFKSKASPVDSRSQAALRRRAVLGDPGRLPASLGLLLLQLADPVLGPLLGLPHPVHVLGIVPGLLQRLLPACLGVAQQLPICSTIHRTREGVRYN